jgi:hypothetical protein
MTFHEEASEHLTAQAPRPSVGKSHLFRSTKSAISDDLLRRDTIEEESSR